MGRIWEIRKKIIGGKKGNKESSAILDPKTKQLVVSKKQIKEVVLNYCKATLQSNKEETGYEEIIKEKQEQVRENLKANDGDFEANYETFKYLIAEFKRSGKQNYDFLVKAGEMFQTVIFLFCKRLIEEEKFPPSFKETMLHQIFKGGKGRREVLCDNRFVH